MSEQMPFVCVCMRVCVCVCCDERGVSHLPSDILLRFSTEHHRLPSRKIPCKEDARCGNTTNPLEHPGERDEMSSRANKNVQKLGAIEKCTNP